MDLKNMRYVNVENYVLRSFRDSDNIVHRAHPALKPDAFFRACWAIALSVWSVGEVLEPFVTSSNLTHTTVNCLICLGGRRR